MQPIAGPQQVRTSTTIYRIQILKAVTISLAIDLKQSLHQDSKTPLNDAAKGV
jgi:hypothetical protein